MRLLSALVNGDEVDVSYKGKNVEIESGVETEER